MKRALSSRSAPTRGERAAGPAAMPVGGHGAGANQLDTRSVAVLVGAVGAGSLSAAARELGMSAMAASRRLAALERDLGVRLAHRTTRSLALTPEGEAFLPFARAMIEAEAAARAVLHRAAEGAEGLLRVTAPAAFGRKRVAPLVPALLRSNPGLRIELDLNDAIVDLVGGGFDVALRIAPLPENGLVARRLARSPRVLCAAPAYLAARPPPCSIGELARHECLTLARSPEWTFVVGDRKRRVRVGGRFVASSMDALSEACVGGAGLALFSRWNVRDELRDGRLVEVPLADGRPEALAIWAVYPTARQVLPKLRVFVAALEASLAADEPAPRRGAARSPATGPAGGLRRRRRVPSRRAPRAGYAAAVLSLRERLLVVPQVGLLQWVGARHGHDEPMVELAEGEFLAGRGLVGDRAARAKVGGKRQVTLVQYEHLPAIASFAGRPKVEPGRLRRNLVVSGVNLVALKGLRFAIGDEVVLEGTGACEP
ncbi:MAG TPA: LysR substrate-binding domain-containing protein, partial [Polyangiaceae bacterium]|nr:LysR substrate-binding domain-containing protein [Polyangiaceae bacterium]